MSLQSPANIAPAVRLNVFRFHYAYARAPAAAGGEDIRELAVRFESIDFIHQPE